MARRPRQRLQLLRQVRGKTGDLYRMTLLTCGNCGHDFEVNSDNIYWMDGPYADCPECGAYNHTEIQRKEKDK